MEWVSLPMESIEADNVVFSLFLRNFVVNGGVDIHVHQLL